MIGKEYSYRKLSSIFFILFVLSVGIHKSNELISKIVGINIQGFVSVSLLSFPILFLFLSYYYSPSRKMKSTNFKDFYLFKFLIFYINLLFIYGVLNGNDIFIISLEYWTGIIVFVAYKISTSENIWQLFEGKLKIVFFIFSVLVFLGNGFTQSRFVELGYDALQSGGTTTGLFSYEMSPILDFWPFLFLIGFFDKNIKRSRIMVFAPLIIYLSFQVFFLKRAPSVRAITYLIVAFGMKIKITNNNNNNSSIRQLFTIIIIVIGALFFTPGALVDRFNTKDTARQDEVKNMYSQLSAIELLFGRGLGGHYDVEQGGIVQYISDDGKDVNSLLHIGFAYPILKGGFLLFFLIFYHIVKTVYINLKIINKLSKEELSSLAFLIVYSVFRLIEGPFSTGAIFDALLFGMSLGCLNRNKNYGFKNPPN
jgi:hypothetical protein